MKSCNMLNIFDINEYMVSTFVRISACEDWFRPNRNIYRTRSSLGDPLFVPQYLVMHSKQSILYIGPKIYKLAEFYLKMKAGWDYPEAILLSGVITITSSRKKYGRRIIYKLAEFYLKMKAGWDYPERSMAEG